MTRTSNPRLRQAWQSRIDAQPNSGLTVAQFCTQHRCSVASFYYWKRKLAPHARPDQQTRREHDLSVNPFIQLHTTPCGAAENRIELALPGGTVARISLDPVRALELILRYSHAPARE